jgi:hypothetical protein
VTTTWRQIDEVKGRLVSVGVCPQCHYRLAREGKLYCLTCVRRRRAYLRARQGYKGRFRCSICRRKGHDRRTCASAKAKNYWSNDAAPVRQGVEQEGK